MPSIIPFLKLFIRSFLRSFFNPFVFQTPYLSDFTWQIYLIYRAQSGFKGFIMFKSGYFFNNFTLKFLAFKALNFKAFTILLLTCIPFSEVSAQHLSREEAMEELYQQHLARLNLDLLTTESEDQARYLEELWETYAYYLRHPLAVNSASLPELLQLPVIEQIRGGEALMEALVVFRTKQPIEDLYDLLHVQGVGPPAY